MNKAYEELAARAEEKMDKCAKASARYFPPGQITLLIVGESPPIAPSYFYIPEDLVRRHQGLPSKIFRVLFSDAGRIDKERCKELLRRFQANGYLLMDLVPYPIDCFPNATRARIIQHEFDAFEQKLSTLEFSSKSKRLVLLPKRTRDAIEKDCPNVSDRLQKLGFGIYEWKDAEAALRPFAKEVPK